MAISGRKTRALYHLREALANQAAFQTLTGTGNATAAKARIVLYGAEAGDLPDRMFVIMRPAAGETREQVAVGTFAPGEIEILVVVEGAIAGDNQDDFSAANDEAGQDWDALRTAIEACDDYSHDGALLRVSRVEEIVEDEEVGALTWPGPEDSERVAAETECPFWQARAVVVLGGARG